MSVIFFFFVLLTSHRVTGGVEDENSIHTISVNSTLAELTANCPTYCVDQVQYNSICVEGCKKWTRGLGEGCGLVCNGSEANFREFHACQVGCSKVIEDYYFHITGVLGVPDPPTLISDSLTWTSLRLEWDRSLEPLPYLAFTVQKRSYLRNQPWETIPSEPLNTTAFTVTGLRSYTEYQFRIGWIIAHDFPPFYSLESTPIGTLAKGLPNSPEITSIQPISNTSVSVTWSPPSQPNGPLIAYVLKLQHLPDGHLIIKEIPIIANHNQRGYTFSGLVPNTNYSLAISVQNREGEGDAAFVTFLTPQSAMSNDISKKPEPKLLIQGIRDIYIQQMDLLLEPDVSVFVSNQNVTAMSAHFRKKWVFIATADGQVLRTSLSGGNQTVVILEKEKLGIQVAFLSVDWLHDKLYLVGKKKRSSTWSIKRSDLNGARLQTVLPSIGSKPIDFMADPYTGYLYWVAPRPFGAGTGDGLYKMDLTEEDYVSKPVIPLLEEDGLGPFTVDFQNYRILIVHKARNTVLSVTLDGEKTDIRGNTHSPNFGDVESIGSYGGVFYWTTGQSVVVEEYNEAQNTFYHNSYEVSKNHQPCSRLLIVHPLLQPTPTPMAPPLVPHALFAQRKARLLWRPPPQIAGLGEGSWRDWKYEIRISENISFSGVNETQFLLNNLNPLTDYTFQVLAYSESGRGPLSVPFSGRTLRPAASNLTLLWGSESGLYSSDLLGENVNRFVSPTQWRNIGENWSISSLSAYGPSHVFFSINNGSVFEWMGGSRSGFRHIRGIDFAQSIAFEPIAQKLYWCNPKKQAILRTSLGEITDNSKLSIDWIPIVTTASEIRIDSERALLFWTTGHSIESSRLNGYNQSILFSQGLFTGIRIISFTIDIENQRLFWVSRTSAGSSIYSLGYSTMSQAPVEIVHYDETSIRGPVRYYSDRLLWLEGGSVAMVKDLYGSGSAELTLDSISNITQVLVTDQSERSSLNRSMVTPGSVLPWSISVNGKWDGFSITWQPVNITSSALVFYEVTLNDYNSKPTSQPVMIIDNNGNITVFPQFKPYSEIEISVTAVTFWASSKTTTVKRQTPSGKPSEPLNPRIFLDKVSYPYFSPIGPKAELIKGELRWDSPNEPNGVILGYLIHCWKGGTKTSDCFLQVDLRKSSCEIKNLTEGTTYQFAIQGYTDAGLGRMSRKITVETDHRNPVPRLLLTAADKIQVMDIDRNNIVTISSPYNPITATYSEVEDSLFWFDEGQYLMKSKFNGNNKTRVLSLNDSEASHLLINWISRKLFWISESTQRNIMEKYSIKMYDLNGGGKAETVLSSISQIKAIAINPFQSTLLWTTSRGSGIVTLYSSQDDGTSMGPFLSRDQTCNCSQIQSIGDAITFDATGTENGPPRGILLTDHSTIWLADEVGCSCYLMANLSRPPPTRSLSAPYRLTGARQRVYWTSMQAHNTHSFYASEKGGGGVTELANGNGPFVREIAVIGPSAQPFPEKSCLVPTKLEVDQPVLLNHSAHSLTLRLPRPEMINCSFEKVSTSTPIYTLFYGTVDDNGITECTKSSPTHCKTFKNGSSLVQIQNLYPYTSYTVFLTLTNYYREIEKLQPLVSSPIVLWTAPGAPMPPKFLRLSSLTPTTVQVIWGQPEKLNGGKVWYAVEWEIKGAKSRPNHIWAATDAASNHNNTEFQLNVTSLLPSTTYTIWVSAFSELGDEFSKSELKEITTFGNPNNLTLNKATPHQLIISWTVPNNSRIVQHQIVYRVGWSSEWNFTELIEGTITGHVYNISVIGLKPKTIYGFRLKAWYEGDPSKPFNWPTDSQYEMETLADKPGSPGVPVVRGIGKALHEISWEKAEENGGTVDLYSLECLLKFSPDEVNNTELHQHSQRRKRETVEMAQKFVFEEPSTGPSLSRWFVVYNGTESRWEVSGLDLRSRYEFRVRARNYYGWGEYSRESSIVSLGDLTVLAEPQNAGMVFGVIALGVCSLGSFGLLFIYVYRRKQKEKPALQGSPTVSERREVELATLRELPGGVHQNNILYAQDLLLDFDLDGIPLNKIKRNQITLLTLLGSGAFGDVYEGYATNLYPGQPSTHTLGVRVAIKTLRKGASSKQKLQFIEEARLMAQFRHPHILEFLGICLDADPCLILELMSEGDLLSHLRLNRIPGDNPNPSTFTLSDLLRICLDVAKGCAYLEEQHFVHRDLAARNCLVRLIPTETGVLHRVVKIGDFGLARDIYKNDYYRKEGEGLLPVRWMSPESLVDLVFTTQSDVWSFGVLVWEIMTLGNHPYPARSNVEVLNFVRTGGRLQEPPNCPSNLTSLMFACWEYEADNRPSFKDCLNHLERIQEAHNIRITQTNTNQRPYYQNTQFSITDHPHNELGISMSENIRQEESNEEESSVFPEDLREHRQHKPRLPCPEFYRSDTPPQLFPKYLEVLSDTESISNPSLFMDSRPTSIASGPVQGEFNDGYEIPLPRKPARNPLRVHVSRFSSLSSSGGDDIGLPSPPPYWNTRRVDPCYYTKEPPSEFFFSKEELSEQRLNDSRPQFRNLLNSSTSEEPEEFEYLGMTLSNQKQSTNYRGFDTCVGETPPSPSEYLGFTFNNPQDQVEDQSEAIIYYATTTRPCLTAANSG